jgi:hypothetical protein
MDKPKQRSCYFDKVANYFVHVVYPLLAGCTCGEVTGLNDEMKFNPKWISSIRKKNKQTKEIKNEYCTQID